MSTVDGHVPGTETIAYGVRGWKIARAAGVGPVSRPCKGVSLQDCNLKPEFRARLCSVLSFMYKFLLYIKIHVLSIYIYEKY